MIFFDAEEWDPESVESRYDQQVSLGLAYARLGHQRRRRYVQNAVAYDYKPAETPFPRPLDAIPHNLLTAQERELNQYYSQIWVRTDYSPGSDNVHANMIAEVPDDVHHFDPLEPIVDNSERYAFSSEGDGKYLEKVLAFVPILTELETSRYSYPDENTPWEDKQLQFYLNLPTEGDSEDVTKEKRMKGQRNFFVAGSEALATGYILWIHLDEFVVAFSSP
ncbi:hypothetical protein G7Y89_g13948 [Cudoniella acicularis]|uniref:Uncharacterized protein n=1 Tax=Cudoniella acicularis TaxID=354080 RepID=A0A8H4VVK6_9HELO|nr:hypothetical protein G7Y89_g13948 [Cudoniella acicularis]